MTETEINNANAEARIKWEFGEPHFLYGYLPSDHVGHPIFTIQRRMVEGYRLFGRRLRYITDFKSLKSAKACAERLAAQAESTTPEGIRKMLLFLKFEIERQLEDLC